MIYVDDLKELPATDSRHAGLWFRVYADSTEELDEIAMKFSKTREDRRSTGTAVEHYMIAGPIAYDRMIYNFGAMRLGTRGQLLRFFARREIESKRDSDTATTRQRAILEITAERERQVELWGTETRTPVEYMSILVEEVGEASEHANKLHWPSTGSSLSRLERLVMFRAELVQTAAVALQIIEAQIDEIDILNQIETIEATIAEGIKR